MSAGPTSGTYVATARLVTGSEFRAVFATPAGEGLKGATSAAFRVVVGGCAGSTCPLAPPAAAAPGPLNGIGTVNRSLARAGAVRVRSRCLVAAIAGPVVAACAVAPPSPSAGRAGCEPGPAATGDAPSPRDRPSRRRPASPTRSEPEPDRAAGPSRPPRHPRRRCPPRAATRSSGSSARTPGATAGRTARGCRARRSRSVPASRWPSPSPAARRCRAGPRGGHAPARRARSARSRSGAAPARSPSTPRRPGRGRWRSRSTFADGLGSATWYWRLDVR